MYAHRSIPCALNSKQLAMTFRDVARLLNHFSSEKEDVAVASPRGLICQGWDALPKWVRLADVRRGDGEVILSIDMVEDRHSAAVDELFEELTGLLASLVSHPVKPFLEHVFGIGWSKTGTMSLTEALRMLGLFSWHCAPWIIGLKHRTDEIALPSIDFTGVVDYRRCRTFPFVPFSKNWTKLFRAVYSS